MSKRRTEKRMGRPPKPPAERHAERVTVRLRKAERLRLERAAKSAGLCLSEYVRAAALARAEQEA